MRATKAIERVAESSWVVGMRDEQKLGKFALRARGNRGMNNVS